MIIDDPMKNLKMSTNNMLLYLERPVTVMILYHKNDGNVDEDHIEGLFLFNVTAMILSKVS
jgi:hypothetical protein